MPHAEHVDEAVEHPSTGWIGGYVYQKSICVQLSPVDATRNARLLHARDVTTRAKQGAYVNRWHTDHGQHDRMRSQSARDDRVIGGEFLIALVREVSRETGAPPMRDKLGI